MMILFDWDMTFLDEGNPVTHSRGPNCILEVPSSLIWIRVRFCMKKPQTQEDLLLL